MSYLIHFNKNHDPKNGQFTFSKDHVVADHNKNISDAKTAMDEYKKALNNIHVDKKSANEMLDYMEENCGISNDTSKNRFQRIKDMCDDEELFELICMETIDNFINKKLTDNKELMSKRKELDNYSIYDHNDTDYMHDTYIRIEKELEDLSHSGVDDTDYLMHFNKNHDKKNGRFTFGDGDGDGVNNDHENRMAYKIKDNLSNYDVGSKYGIRKDTEKHNKESDTLAILAGEKYRSLYTVNRTKEVAERLMAADPKRFKKSQERKDYTDAVMYTYNSYENTNKFIKEMTKKYKTVDYDIKQEEKTGESYVQAILEDKNKNRYITEMYLGTHVVN